MSDLKERVERGAALLDEKEPGWRDRISPGDLELRDCARCVLGQVFGEYGEGLFKLWPSSLFDDEPEDHGFMVWEESSYDSLNAEWLRYLKGEAAA